MNKNDSSIKPLFFDNLKTDFEEIQRIKDRFMHDQKFINFYQSKAAEFPKIK